MTCLKRRGLIAAMVALMIGLPRLCPADQAVFASWTGTESYSEEDFVNGQIVDFREIVNPWSTFDVGYMPGVGAGMVTDYATIGGPDVIGGFGPQSGSLSWTNFLDSGDFEASHDSILPNGEIDPVNSYAVADISVSILGTGGNGAINFDSFTSRIVPEPVSIVQAMAGINAISIFMWMRGHRPQVSPPRTAVRLS